MSIIIAFIIILLTISCYIFISDKFKKSYGIIASTLLFILLVSTSLIWYFYPIHLTFGDIETLEINLVLPSGKYLKLNETEKKELINLIEKTEFKRGKLDYIPYSEKIIHIILGGGTINRNNQKRVSVNFSLWNDESYGEASINNKPYYFESSKWRLLVDKYIETNQ